MTQRTATRTGPGSWLLPLAAFVALAVLVSADVALTMAPGLTLAAVLLTGRRPGEALIDRWRGRPERPRPVRRPQRGRPPALALVVRAVGGAFSAALAMRPPPRAPLSAA